MVWCVCVGVVWCVCVCVRARAHVCVCVCVCQPLLEPLSAGRAALHTMIAHDLSARLIVTAAYGTRVCKPVTQRAFLINRNRLLKRGIVLKGSVFF